MTIWKWFLAISISLAMFAPIFSSAQAQQMDHSKMGHYQKRPVTSATKKTSKKLAKRANKVAISQTKKHVHRGHGHM